MKNQKHDIIHLAASPGFGPDCTVTREPAGEGEWWRVTLKNAETGETIFSQETDTATPARELFKVYAHRALDLMLG